MSAIRLGSLTSPEAAELGAGGEAIGLIGVGALEQHGPHLPMIMDSWYAELLVEAVAERIDAPVVLMPVLAPGRSDPHLAFPGTVSLPEEVFQGVLKAYVEAFERIGIRRVAIVSGHGSNYPSLGSFVKAYRATEGGTEVIAHDTMEGLLGFLTAGARAAGLEPLASDAHAGLVETSLALHLFDRGQVRDFSAVEGWATTDPDWVERLMSEGLENVSPSGVLGNPAGADATAGATIFEAGADGFADWICSAFGLERVSG